MPNVNRSKNRFFFSEHGRKLELATHVHTDRSSGTNQNIQYHTALRVVYSGCGRAYIETVFQFGSDDIYHYHENLVYKSMTVLFVCS